MQTAGDLSKAIYRRGLKKNGKMENDNIVTKVCQQAIKP